MSDVFSKQKRSEVMALIRSKNSKAELLVFKFLRRNNVYFQRHYKRAHGTPDIALPGKKRAVFIDGDFWHGRTYEKVLAKYGPDNYWSQKIARNIQRDETQRAELEALGWEVLAVWESDIKRKRTQGEAFESIRRFLVS